MLPARGVRVEWLGAVDDDFGQLGVQFFEDLLREAGADVADGFVGVVGRVVAREQERAVDGGSFSPAVVCAENDEV